MDRNYMFPGMYFRSMDRNYMISGNARQIHGADVHASWYITSMPRAREQDPDAKRFGEILSSLRIARSWTLGDLGEASGMHPDFLGLLERGMNLPSLRTILRIAEVFEIPPGKIVDEIAAKRPPRRS